MKNNHAANADVYLKDNDIIQVTGDLRFATVMGLDAKAKRLFSGLAACHFDFSQVTSSDSAGLALVVEWIRFAKEHKQSVTIDHLPENLMAIAAVSGLSGVLKLG